MVKKDTGNHVLETPLHSCLKKTKNGLVHASKVVVVLTLESKNCGFGILLVHGARTIYDEDHMVSNNFGVFTRKSMAILNDIPSV